MIPFTFPSSPSLVTGNAECKIFYLSSVTGLAAWKDYIPVRSYTSSAPVEGTTDAAGYQAVKPLSSTTGLAAWTDYIPVYEDASLTKPWSTDAGGYIPVGAAGSRLSLNFAGTTVIDSRITFTRASNATYFNSSGVLTTAGNNVARLDYDPATLLPRGLLIEEQRTNLLLNSDVAGTNLATQSITVTAAPWTVSFTGTGTITFSGAYTGSLVGTGAATRVTSTFTPSAGSLTCTVTGTVKWAQAELGSFATSFIPTTTASATRSADSVSMTGTNFSSWFNATQGTFVVEWVNQNVGTGGASGAYSVNDGTATNKIDLRANLGRNLATGGTGWVIDTGAPAASTIHKVANSFIAGSQAASRNGAAAVTASAATLPPSINTLNIGYLDSSAGSYRLNGHIRRLQFYPVALPSATLQTLTA